ncbi:MAG: ABC transporter permease subunit, partial [Actinobacteria bacterium]|nr:ABC transporter permease subunit [Actinomycetota bacterium]
MIYALPPMVRLTALGIQQVPRSAVEAAQMFGATKRQILAKVQLPLAVPSIITGINQTVMMALGIVVIATLVGAGGL